MNEERTKGEKEHQEMNLSTMEIPLVAITNSDRAFQCGLTSILSSMTISSLSSTAKTTELYILQHDRFRVLSSPFLASSKSTANIINYMIFVRAEARLMANGWFWITRNA